jgi:hypothetical protein
MTDTRNALQRLEDPMLELGSASRALDYLASDLAERSPSEALLFILMSRHLKYIYEDMYKHYDAVLKQPKDCSPEGAKDGPSLVS